MMPMPAAPEIAMPPAAPFDAVAETYDDRFSRSLTGRAQREAVWDEIRREFKAGDRVLELNCGTGVDAAYMAGRGIQVLACDASPQMIAVAARRLEVLNVDVRVLPIEQMSRLSAETVYDGAFSNFAGLNCVANLNSVARDLSQLLKPGGTAIVCLFGCFCFWEILFHAARGNVRKAFRRFQRKPLTAKLGPEAEVTIRYVPVRSLRRVFAPHFRIKRWKGIGISVPPSYMEPLAARFPRLLKLSGKADHVLGRCPGIRAMGDHVVLTLERCGA